MISKKINNDGIKIYTNAAQTLYKPKHKSSFGRSYLKKKHKKHTRYILVKQFQLIGIYDKRKLNLKMCLKVSGSSTHKNIPSCFHRTDSQFIVNICTVDSWACNN